MTDDRFSDMPELPSDEELGIAGLDADGAPRGPDPSTDPSKEGRRRKPGAAHPGGWFAALLPVVVLLGAGWLASGHRTLPAPVAANAPDSAFSSGRAMAQLVELARAPRPVGSPEHARARERIVEWLNDLGIEAELHESQTMERRAPGDEVVVVPVRNLVARIPGTGPGSEAVLLTAHYDAVPLSHGAGDAGVGVVAILEVLRALLAGEPMARDLIVLMTDAEELGLLGARAFVEEHRWMSDVRVVLSAEMRGTGGPVEMFETGADNGWVVEVMEAADPSPRTSSLAVEVYRRMPNNTDFTPFREAGIQGLNFAAIGRAEHYHQATDRPENVQEATLQHMGERLLALTRELGSRELGSREMEAVRAPDRVFLTLPWVGIVSYPRGLALPVSAGIFLLWVGLVALPPAPGGGTGGRRLPALLLGGAVPLLTGGAAVLLAWGLLRLLPGHHPEFGTQVPLVYGEGWYMLALALAAGAVFAALARVAGALEARIATRRAGVAAGAAGAGQAAGAGPRRASGSLVHLALGALAWLVFAALGVALVAPLAAMELQVAAAGGVLAAAALLALRGPGGPASALGTGAQVVALLLALPALGALVPVVESVLQAMSLRLALGLAALVSLVLPVVLPALLAAVRPGVGRTRAGMVFLVPLVLAMAALGAAAMGWQQAGGTEDRPLNSTLLYALDREVGEAHWLTLEDAGFAWAESRVGPFGAAEPPHPFPLPRRYRRASAPVVSLAPPELTLRDAAMPGADRVPEDGVQGMGLEPRRVYLELRFGIDAERVSVTIEGDGDGGEGGGEVAIRSVNGVAIPDGRPGTPGARRAIRRILHQGVPLAGRPWPSWRSGGSEGSVGVEGSEASEGSGAGWALVLEVEVPAGTTGIRGTVIEEHLRGPELLGALGREVFQRPPGLLPSAAAGSDRALVRTPFRVEVDDPGASGDPGRPPDAGA